LVGVVDLAGGVVRLLWEVGRADEATMNDLSKEFGREANARRGQWGCGEFAEGGEEGSWKRTRGGRRKPAARGVGDGDVLPAAN